MLNRLISRIQETNIPTILGLAVSVLTLVAYVISRLVHP